MPVDMDRLKELEKIYLQRIDNNPQPVTKLVFFIFIQKSKKKKKKNDTEGR